MDRRRELINALLEQSNKEEYVHNVYKLPSIKQDTYTLQQAILLRTRGWKQ